MSSKLKNNYVKKKTLTTETLKQFEGLENLSDSEAEEVIISLNKLAQISINFFNQNNH
jgi:hypothetical protein